MNRVHFACFGIALALHAAVLFGVRLAKQAEPLPMADESVEVSLVEAAPEPAAVIDDAPEPEPQIEPPPPPAEPMIEPEPEPEPTPVVEEAVLPPKPKPESHPSPSPAKAKPVRSRPPSRPRGADAAEVPRRAAPSGPVVSAKPRYRSNPKPQYPADARRARQEGVVLLRVAVSECGRAGSVSLARSSGFPALDDAALRAVRRWTFEPGRAGGVAVPSIVTVPVRFDLTH